MQKKNGIVKFFLRFFFFKSQKNLKPQKIIKSEKIKYMRLNSKIKLNPTIKENMRSHLFKFLCKKKSFGLNINLFSAIQLQLMLVPTIRIHPKECTSSELSQLLRDRRVRCQYYLNFEISAERF